MISSAVLAAGVLGAGEAVASPDAAGDFGVGVPGLSVALSKMGVAGGGWVCSAAWKVECNSPFRGSAANLTYQPDASTVLPGCGGRL